jgi:hypothetical protein
VAREITLGFSVAKRGVKVIKDNRGRIYRTGGCVILEKSADIVRNIIYKDICSRIISNLLSNLASRTSFSEYEILSI